jgi:hypothetical protein
MSFKRMVLGVGAFGFGLAAVMPGVAEAATQTTLTLANAAPELVEQHAATGAPLMLVAGLMAVALRRQRAWYADPRLAEMMAPLPQDFSYLPPR